MRDLVQKGKLQKWETKKCTCCYHPHALIGNHLQYIDIQELVVVFFLKKGKKLAPNPTPSKQQKSQELHLSL